LEAELGRMHGPRYLPAMFSVLHSSAGAGKTHALVKHYLAHALRGDDPAAYRRVLALTFTNKAAGEMRERVLEYLRSLATGGPYTGAMADVANELRTKAKIDDAALALRAEAVLGHMLHHWGDVAISTIDAFTRRMVRPFARELQLDHELRMTTEQDFYLRRAVESLVAEVGNDPEVTVLLTEACMQLLQEDRGWDPEAPLIDLAEQLTRESSIRPLDMLGALDAHTVLDLRKRLGAQVQDYRARMRAIGREVMDLLRSAGVEGKEMAHGVRGVYSWFKKVAEFRSELDLPGANARKARDTGKWHSGSASPGSVAALERLGPRLAALFDAAVELHRSGYAVQVVREAVLRDLVTVYTLRALADHLEQAKRSDGVVFFSDLTRKVAEVVEHEPASFIHERMGARYRHYLIDEFQDTSLLQWRTLMPLVEEALGTGGSVLLVGDAKQAIYRWRNGEVRLFQRFPAVHGSDPNDPRTAERESVLRKHFQRPGPLASNHRSARTIVEFNNQLFGELKGLLADDLRSVYDDHAQQAWRTDEGLVHLRRMQNEQGAEARAERQQWLLERVKDALAAGFRPADVAVLVRSGLEGHRIAAALVQDGHAVLSPDGLKLSGDPIVEAVIALLRHLHTGDPQVAARAVQWQALMGAQGDRDPYADVATVDPVGRVVTFLQEHVGGGLHTTLTDLIVRLVRAHGVHPARDARVLTLLTEAHAHALAHGQDIGSFLAHWDRSGVARSVEPPATDNAIQVMTIHKSKGLQFPVVIVPDAAMTTRAHVEHLWVDPAMAAPELPVALVRTTKLVRQAGLPEYEEEQAARMLDDLNLLYVAFTRAEQRLYALVPAGASTIGGALSQFMTAQGGPDELVRGSAQPPWPRKKGHDSRELHAAAPPAAAGDLGVRHEAPEEWDPADPDPYRRYGNAVHAAMARVRTVHDVRPALEQAVAMGSIAPDAAQQLITRLEDLLGAPALEPWFGAGLDVRTEATIIAEDGRALRPDRVILAGPVTRVLDIKTGHRSPAHHEQVRIYMRLLGAMGHVQLEGALLYLPEGILETV
jgi:ATP-dependent exoDNAse (exonuclease V) beta subunit